MLKVYLCGIQEAQERPTIVGGGGMAIPYFPKGCWPTRSRGMIISVVFHVNNLYCEGTQNCV